MAQLYGSENLIKITVDKDVRMLITFILLIF